MTAIATHKTLQIAKDIRILELEAENDHLVVLGDELGRRITCEEVPQVRDT